MDVGEQFDYVKDYILEDDLVILSPLRLAHTEELLYMSEEESIWTYFFENGKGYENLSAYITSAVANRASKAEYPFAVFDKKQQRYAGTTRLYQYIEDLKTIKLGHTWYGEAHRGTGLNKRCKYLLFEFVFEKLNLERIGFGAHAENKISIAAMKSVGCKQEGVLRNMFPAINGKDRADCVLMSILREEWLAHVKIELKQKLN